MCIAQKRIKNQLKNLQQNPISNLRVLQAEDWKWRIQFYADKLSPFYGYPITAKIVFPQNYPLNAPKITLEHPEKFFHANLGTEGAICDKILNDQKIIPVRERILEVIQLMGVPNNASPLNSTAANLCQQSRKQWYIKALRIFRGMEKK